MSRRLRTSLATLLAVVSVVVLAGCGASTPSAEQSFPADAVRISANNLTYSTDQLIVPAGKEFTLVFENKEAVPHNVAITTKPDGGGDILFRHDPITAKTQGFTVPAIPAGTWYFHCDVHLSMHGTVIAQ